MGHAEVHTEEVEVVVFRKTRIDIRGVIDAGRCRSDVGEDSRPVEVARAE